MTGPIAQALSLVLNTVFYLYTLIVAVRFLMQRTLPGPDRRQARAVLDPGTATRRGRRIHVQCGSTGATALAADCPLRVAEPVPQHLFLRHHHSGCLELGRGHRQPGCRCIARHHTAGHRSGPSLDQADGGPRLVAYRCAFAAAIDQNPGVAADSAVAALNLCPIGTSEPQQPNRTCCPC